MKRCSALFAALFASPVLAQSSLDFAGIEREVSAFAGVEPSIVVPLDRSLRLAACGQNHALAWYGNRRDMVEVRCPLRGGWRLFVALAGQAAAAGAAPLVGKGDTVTISVRDAGLLVAMPGEALEAGAEGAWIRVRALRAGAPVLRARVLRPGQVGIDLP